MALLSHISEYHKEGMSMKNAIRIATWIVSIAALIISIAAIIIVMTK